jgi:hypothetical protein
MSPCLSLTCTKQRFLGCPTDGGCGSSQRWVSSPSIRWATCTNLLRKGVYLLVVMIDLQSKPEFWQNEPHAGDFSARANDLAARPFPRSPMSTARAVCRRSPRGPIRAAPAESTLSGPSPGSPWCSTPRSTRTSPSSARRKRRSIASCAPAWMSSSWATSWCRGRRVP